jgi:hypothetical protein
MKNLLLGLAFATALAGCSGRTGVSEIPTGSEVTVQKKDGVTVVGRVVEVTGDQVLVEAKDGTKMSVPRAQIVSVKTLTAVGPPPASETKGTAAATGGEAPAAPAQTKTASTSAERDAPPVAPAAPAAPRPDDKTQATPKAPEFREVTIPTGTVLRVTLTTPVASDTSNVEDAVRATLQNAVAAEGVTALPAGATVRGHVTSAERSGKVKGRASIGLRFNSVDLSGDGGTESIQSATISHVAPTTKKKDAAKIGVGAGAGAIIGGIVGGGSGAAKGAAIGGGAGTGAVLATRGEEVRLPAGTALSVKLTAPLTVRVPR